VSTGQPARPLLHTSPALPFALLYASCCQWVLAGMSSIKTRLHNVRSKFLRRSSATSTATRSLVSSAGSEWDRPAKAGSTLRKSISLSKLPEASSAHVDEDGDLDGRLAKSEILGAASASSASRCSAQPSPSSNQININNTHTTPNTRGHADVDDTTTRALPSPAVPAACPLLTLEEPTPIHPPVHPDLGVPAPSPASSASASASAAPSSASKPSLPDIVHHQSAVATTDAPITKTLLVPDIPSAAVATGAPTATDHSGGVPAANFSASMLHRKIWVKRPNASATLVQIREDDLVDDVRDMILKKYQNSLGRSFDSPDVTLRIVPRDAARGQDRTLGPEEEMCRTLDTYFPGGQTVNEALVIDVPQRRTPKPSPQVPVYYNHHDDHRNHQTEYFPPMPVVPSPAAIGTEPRLPLPHAHSIAVLNTGQLPALPSPGGTRRALHHSSRPKYPRHNTASPTTLAGGIPSSATSARPSNRPRHDSSASDTKHSATSNNPIPTPPVPVDHSARQSSNPPTPRVASPQPTTLKKRKKKLLEPSLTSGLLDGSVPPINVLIVEDNIINLRVLGAFMQRLKVRWQRAMNGKEAVTKWKAGGFHLVLMDIQLPVMNGLEATKEIRRLERVNSIGVFSSGSTETPNTRLGQDGNGPEEPQEDDRLGDKGLFKSPVIIVALTASSLQSDRHEALAAGCNDFLTKVRCRFPLSAFNIEY
jgi:osomolarity two-component system response regulator SSK1